MSGFANISIARDGAEGPPLQVGQTQGRTQQDVKSSLDAGAFNCWTRVDLQLVLRRFASETRCLVCAPRSQ